MPAGIKSKFTSWIGGLRQQASDHHPRPRIIGVVDFYNEELEFFADELSCPRRPGERDHAYRHRLALEAEQEKLRFEDIINRLLNPRSSS